MRVFAAQVPDRYYVITARLSAGGHQRTVMRLVAAGILTMALPPLLAVGNVASSSAAGGRVLFAVIPVVCVALAIPWLGARWPSRARSRTMVILGSAVLAAGCVVAANPFSGLLVTTAFPLLLGYGALFHSSRLQLVVAGFAAGAVGWLAVRIALTDVPTALAVAVPVALMNVAVFVGCRTIAEVTAADGERTDVEPLTGLLTRESFDELAGTRLGARNRGDDRYLVLTVVSIDSFAALLSQRGTRGADRTRIAVAQALRDTVRRDTVIGHVGEDEYLIAEVFATPDPAPLAERIRGAVAATPNGDTVSIGVVSTPLAPLSARPPGEVLDEIVELATAAMRRARGRGGNQADYLLGPTLRGAAEPNPEPGPV